MGKQYNAQEKRHRRKRLIKRKKKEIQKEIATKKKS
jgi:hypothetical protein